VKRISALMTVAMNSAAKIIFAKPKTAKTNVLLTKIHSRVVVVSRSLSVKTNAAKIEHAKLKHAKKHVVALTYKKLAVVLRAATQTARLSA
jgi:hypothetical protein